MEMTLKNMREGAPMPVKVTPGGTVVCADCPVTCYMRDKYQRNPCALGECPRLKRWGVEGAQGGTA